MPQTIRTVSANCQDCYRCVRACPINAIWFRDSQAYINNALCVQCGNCVRECPQHAKVIYQSAGDVRAMMDAGEFVVASVDPSFAAAYPGYRAKRLPAALRKLGFSAVSESAEGAAAVAEAYAAHAKDKRSPCITSACPAVVSYIEKYRHDLMPFLLPVVSPMVAHARMLKARHGQAARVVFIGPCAARKNEAVRPRFSGAVDAVLTFEELNEWMDDTGLRLSTCPESGFETFGNVSAARLSALGGGMLHAAGIHTDITTPNIINISGTARVLQALKTEPADWQYDVMELSFCRGGCVGGPCMPHGVDIFTARQSVVTYANQAFSLPGTRIEIPLDADFRTVSLLRLLPPVEEVRIEQILHETGKADKESRLDCGACGYATCRENAIAVARGIAEPDMCISYARKRAEKRADRIIETSPNGIVVVDLKLNIIHANATFQKMFGGREVLSIGMPISHIVDPDAYEKLIAGAPGTQEAIRSGDGIRYQELIYMLPGGQEIIGIYVDISATTFSKSQVELMRGQSLSQVQELLSHQIRFSQEMAHFLGKSTAQTEELVGRILSLYDSGQDAPDQHGDAP